MENTEKINARGSIKSILREIIREEVKAELTNRESISDSTKCFIEEKGYYQSPTNFIPLQQLYEDYQDYCYQKGDNVCSDRIFRGRLTDLGFFSKKRSIGIVVFAERAVGNKYLQRLYSAAFKVSNEQLKSEIIHNLNQFAAWRLPKK